MLFANVFMMYPRAAVSAERIEEIIHGYLRFDEMKMDVNRNNLSWTGRFLDTVTFAYPRKYRVARYLENVSYCLLSGGNSLH